MVFVPEDKGEREEREVAHRKLAVYKGTEETPLGRDAHFNWAWSLCDLKGAFDSWVSVL